MIILIKSDVLLDHEPLGLFFPFANPVQCCPHSSILHGMAFDGYASAVLLFANNT